MLTSADVIVNGCIMPFSTSALWVIPPQRRYPDRPPLMVKGVLVVVKIMRTKTLFIIVREMKFA